MKVGKVQGPFSRPFGVGWDGRERDARQEEVSENARKRETSLDFLKPFSIPYAQLSISLCRQSVNQGCAALPSTTAMLYSAREAFYQPACYVA